MQLKVGNQQFTTVHLVAYLSYGSLTVRKLMNQLKKKSKYLVINGTVKTQAKHNIKDNKIFHYTVHFYGCLTETLKKS